MKHRGQEAPNTIDGYSRPREKEEYLNSIAPGVFSTGGGREFLNYLRSITMNHVAPGWLSNEELHYLEGARWLVGIIMRRMVLGQQKGVTHVPELPDPDPLA